MEDIKRWKVCIISAGFFSVNVWYCLDAVFIRIEVTFEGITGTSFTGDIAIDDVSIVEGMCQGTYT